MHTSLNMPKRPPVRRPTKLLWAAPWTGIFVAVVVLACGKPPIADEEPQTPRSVPVADATTDVGSDRSPSQASGERRVVDISRPYSERLVADAWWNQDELVAALELTGSQRAALDQLLTAAFEHQQQADRARGQNFQTFASALEAGNEEEALRYAQLMSAGVADQARVRSDMMIQGMKLLSAEQREKLLQEAPSSFRRSWLRSNRASRGQDRLRAARARAARPNAAGSSAAREPGS